MTAQLNLSLSELTAAKHGFALKYHATTDPEANFAKDIRVNWTALKNAVESVISWPAEQTLLRFIHRYDEGGWFLTMECCHVAEDGTIDRNGTRFDLRDGGFQVSEGFTANYDQNYFDNVSYEGVPMIRGAQVNYLLFPWSQELKAAALVNNVLDAKDMDIVFSSISYDFGTDRSRVGVQWPHSLAFYFSSKDGVDLLDDLSYEGSGVLVRNKAYDYADPCPSNCSNSYPWPSFFEAVKPYL